MACVNVAAADSDDEATRVFTSLQLFFKGVITGKREQLQPPSIYMLNNERPADLNYGFYKVTVLFFSRCKQASALFTNGTFETLIKINVFPI